MMQRVVLVPLARLFAAWLLVSPLVGRAQVADSGATYAGVIDRAVNEFGHGNWAEAHALFSRAHELQPSARTFRGLGIVAFELRQYLEAKSLLEQALIDARLPLVPEQQASTRALLQRIAQFVGELQISVSPDSAEATLDGKDLSGGLIPLSVGVRELVVRAPGYVTVRRSIQIEGGRREDVHIELKPSLAVPASPGGVAAASAATGEFDAIISAARADEAGTVLRELRSNSRWVAYAGVGYGMTRGEDVSGGPSLAQGTFGNGSIPATDNNLPSSRAALGFGFRTYPKYWFGLQLRLVAQLELFDGLIYHESLEQLFEEATGLGFQFALDPTVRFGPFSSAFPLYIGLGPQAAFRVLTASGETQDFDQTALLVGGQVEIGALFGDTESIDVFVRADIGTGGASIGLFLGWAFLPL